MTLSSSVFHICIMKFKITHHIWDDIVSIAAAANIVTNNVCMEISFSLPKNLNFLISSLAVKNTVMLHDKIPFNKSPLPVIHN